MINVKVATHVTVTWGEKLPIELSEISSTVKCCRKSRKLCIFNFLSCYVTPTQMLQRQACHSLFDAQVDQELRIKNRAHTKRPLEKHEN